MLLTTSRRVQNQVYSASIAVEFDSLETAYSRAYAEPRIDVAGTIPYTPSSPVPPSDLVFDLTEELGSQVGTPSASQNPASGNWELISGGEVAADFDGVNGLLQAVSEAAGDVLFETQIDFIDNLPVAGTLTYLVGFAVVPGTGVTPDEAGLFFGFGEQGGARKILAVSRDAGAPGTILGSVLRSSPLGVYLRLTREGNTYTFAYSLNNGSTWTALATAELSTVAPRIGLFVSSGDDTDQLHVLFSKLVMQTVPAPAPGEFVIGGGPKLYYLRSQSPHTFSLDANLDPEAEAKVDGWVDEITARAVAAKTALLLNPNPGTDPTVTVQQA